MPTNHPYKGRCLCRGLRFAFGEPVGGSAHCHCSMCREAHGAATVTWIVTFEANFRITAGEDLLHWYSSSEEAQRGFCSRCGTTMFFKSTLCPGEVHVTRANLETKAPKEPGFHCFWEERVSWLDFADDLPKLTADGEELAHYKTRKGYKTPNGAS